MNGSYFHPRQNSKRKRLKTLLTSNKQECKDKQSGNTIILQYTFPYPPQAPLEAPSTTHKGSKNGEGERKQALNPVDQCGIAYKLRS